jgi:hypothetical protein
MNEQITEAPAQTPIKKPSKPIIPIAIGGSVGLLLLFLVAPSFLNQSSKSRQWIGKATIGVMTRAQSSHFLSNAKFAATLPDLSNYGMDGDQQFLKELIKTEHVDYFYVIYASNNPGFLQQAAIPKTPGLKAYLSLHNSNLSNIPPIICESLEATHAIPQMQPGQTACPSGFKPL